MVDNTYRWRLYFNRWRLYSRDANRRSVIGCLEISVTELFNQKDLSRRLRNRSLVVNLRGVRCNISEGPPSSRPRQSPGPTSFNFFWRPSSREEVPSNSLAISENMATYDGQEWPVELFRSGNKFPTEAPSNPLTDDAKFGFIVMDGNRVLFGALYGNTRDVLHELTVALPMGHGRVPQYNQIWPAFNTDYLLKDCGSKLAGPGARFDVNSYSGERLKCWCCHKNKPTTVEIRVKGRICGQQQSWGLCSCCFRKNKIVREVAETAVQVYLTNDEPNVTGLILAGSEDFQTELMQSHRFDPRLQARVLKLIAVEDGGESGFNQAIQLASEALPNVRFIQEMKLVERYFDEIAQDTGKFCFGVDDTLKALEMGAVDTLIVCENLDIQRFVLKNHSLDEEKVLHLRPDQELDQTNFIDQNTGVRFELIIKDSLVDWLTNNHKNFGAKLEIITDRSNKGSQFRKTFEGIGGILNKRVNSQSVDINDNEGIDDSDEDCQPVLEY